MKKKNRSVLEIPFKLRTYHNYYGLINQVIFILSSFLLFYFIKGQYLYHQVHISISQQVIFLNRSSKSTNLSTERCRVDSFRIGSTLNINPPVKFFYMTTPIAIIPI